MDILFDLYRTLRFATRLPLPETQREREDPIVGADGFAISFALAGGVLGLLGALVPLGLSWLGATPLLTALLTVAFLVLASGALHEDGLADFADGLGGGRTRERKLDIMRDPTIGTYGVLALVLGVGVRVVTLSTLIASSPWIAVGLLIGLQALSRAFSMLTSAGLDLARSDGASAQLGRPSHGHALVALGIAVIVFVLAMMPMLVMSGQVLAMLGSMLAVLLSMAAGWIWVAWLARRHLGGQTGDVLGATQQVSDLAGWVAASILLTAIV